MTTNDAGKHKVLGLGGVFVHARDPKALAAWYREHLGFDVHDFGGGSFGAMFNFAGGVPDYQLWTAFPPTSKKFAPEQPAMLNLRVADLDGLLAQLRVGGVSVEEKVERSDYGRS